ncbi:MAG: respiratory nitrate reductase subunit gamma [Gammaproteobacteria bacterium]|nr:respiratory nitrate reductase subunit gamma [Gammaproteobacteria bacterium]
MTFLFATLFYISLGVLIVGVALKIRQYWKTPAPLKIPTMPAPTTQAGVVFRMAREVILFESLFRSTKWTWMFGWMFHFGLLLAFVRHLRYVMSPDFILWPLINNWLVQFAGQYASLMILFGLLGLLARRIFVDRVRYISAPSDYLMLILLLVITVSGIMMSFVTPIDIVSLKAFMMDLITLDSGHELPVSVPLVIHLGLVALLALIFPFSKLLHAPGLFFSPSRNQVDNPRERRHISDWAKKLES